MVLIVVLLFLGVTNCAEIIIRNEDKLIHTQIIFRHGDRTILRTYPNDPYKDKSHWPEGLGQMTNAGKQREYQLGQFFHRRYGQFLGTYAPDKISILSSDFDRTISSANLVLAALFPPEGNEVWNENLLWQPIPVHTIPQNIDRFIENEIACPRYLRSRKEYDQSPDIVALFRKHQSLIEYLEANSGLTIQTVKNFKDIYEALDIEHNANKTLPEWTREVYIPGGPLDYLKTYWIKTLTATPLMKRLKSGFLLKEILDRFQNKTRSLLPDEIMRMYSGHDLTIAPLMNTLDIFELQRPPYGSSLMFEMRESNDDHYVQVLYRNTTAEHLAPINIPNCGTKCPLSRLYELYKDFLPSDYETECELDFI